MILKLIVSVYDNGIIDNSYIDAGISSMDWSLL